MIRHARRLAALLIIATPLVASAAETPLLPPGASARVDAIRHRGILPVAVLDEYPWLKQTPGAPEPFAGPAWLLAKDYARRLGVTLATVPVAFADKVSVLADGRADIVVAPLLMTPERAKAVDPIVYSMSGQCLFGLASNPKVARAERIEDLNRPGVTLAYNIGTPQADWAMGKLPRAQHLGVPGTIADVRLSEIQSHRADVGSIDKFFFAGFAKRTPGLVSAPRGDACVISRELPIPIAMAVAKGQPAFVEWLRAVAQSDLPQLAAEETRIERIGS